MTAILALIFAELYKFIAAQVTRLAFAGEILSNTNSTDDPVLLDAVNDGSTASY